MSTARGTFTLAMTPAEAELDGAVNRMEFTKTFHGDLDGTGVGIMLSSGDPRSGEAGYVAVETVHGRLGARIGGFALAQFGSVHNGGQTLHYEVIPGSGNGGLTGIAGVLQLTIDDDGTHHYDLDYQV